ncbi:hypothetical protein [Bacillus thuringiensis]|uniref:hypothetical protein n=1 Tax=Bacillus thuringiensis TaxID=1428 RepID=UPI0011A2BDA4|nr:hypothetical protein [Bacillus thuringiensis]
MAIEQKVFPLEWMEQYRLSDNWWNGGYSPIRAGSQQGYISFLGTPAGVREAIVTSKTPAKVYLRLYFYYGGDFLVGKHQLSSRPTTSTKPYHLALTGWEFTPDVNQYQDYNITGVIRDDLISGKYQGVTMWNNMNTPASECWGAIENPYRAYWVVEGDWNVPPQRPRLDYPTFGVTVNQELEVRWTPPTNEPNPNILKYDIAISDDNSYTWTQYNNVGANGVTSYKINTYNLNQTRKAVVAIRAFDGEFYSEWNYSDRFTIFHEMPPKAPINSLPAVGATIDRTAINTFSWKADPKAIQMGYQFRWRTVASDSSRGSWNYTPSSTVFVNSTSQYYNMPASTVPAGMFEWSVKTMDDFNLQSAWSTEQLAISANPSTAPNMVYPFYATVHPQATMVVEWTSIDQLQFELFLKNSGGVTLWSTTGTTERSVRLGYTLATNETYKIQVRVNSSGVWSNFVTTDFSVNFAAPAVPIIQRIEEAGSGVTNIVYNQGELGFDLPPLTKDGSTFQLPWSVGMHPTKTTPLTANSFKFDATGLSGSTNCNVGAYLDSSMIPFHVGSTYTFTAYSNNKGVRVAILMEDASGTVLVSASYPLYNAGTYLLEATASVVMPAGTVRMKVLVENVANAPMLGQANNIMSGMNVKITSPVTTNRIDVYRRAYSPTGDVHWTYLGGNPMLSSVTKNLLPKAQGNLLGNTNGGTNNVVTTYESEYNWTYKSNVVTDAVCFQVNVTPNTDYTLYCWHNGNIGIFNRDATVNMKPYTTAKCINFNAGNNTSIRCYFKQQTANTVANFTNHMLVQGTYTDQTIGFEPMRPNGIQGGFLDYTPASQTLYEYKLVAWNLINNTKSESPPFQFIHKFNDTIIQDVDRISDLYFLTMVTDRDSSTEVDSALQRFAGRKDPVREYGENETTEVSIEWEVDTWFEAKQISDLLNAREVYLYRDGSGRKMFVSTEKVNMKDKQISGFVMSCDFTKTHYDATNLAKE